MSSWGTLSQTDKEPQRNLCDKDRCPELGQVPKNFLSAICLNPYFYIE